MFGTWLSRMAFVLEGLSAFMEEREQEDRRSTDKRFSKMSNFSASSNLQEAKPMQSDHCPPADNTNKIWNCPLFRNMSVNVWYAAVRKQRLCYGCLGKGHAIKDCKVNACGINRCTKQHNQLLHSKNKLMRGITQSGDKKINTCAFPDSESTVLFIDERAREVTSQRHPC